ncbi:MAG: DUF2314 domain-containing protein [Verrucomicrobia bacterium]|nr:DUF2314 domain-containing protein [Verrucomicrobiota bacterium]
MKTEIMEMTMKRILFALLVAGLTGQLNAQQSRGSNTPRKDVAMKVSANLEQRTQTYVNLAMTTYPAAKQRFLRGLPAGSRFSVVTRFYEKNGSWEQVFVSVNKITGQTIHGQIASKTTRIRIFKVGDPITVPEGAILDWCILDPQGNEEGNYVGKFLDAYRLKKAVMSIALKRDANDQIVGAGFRMAMTPEEKPQDVSYCIPESVRRAAEQMILNRDPQKHTLIIMHYNNPGEADKQCALVVYDIQNEKLEPLSTK